MINKSFKARTTRVEWEGEYLGTVHPLGPDAFVEIAAVAAPAIADIFATVEETSMSLPKTLDAGAWADFILANGPSLIRRVGASAPELLDEIILQGYRCADDPEARDLVSREYSLPARMHAVAAVVRATFIDDKALRDLLGNVQALLGVGDALSRATAQTKSPKTSPAQPSLVDG